jgi:hypothetical protein
MRRLAANRRHESGRIVPGATGNITHNANQRSTPPNEGTPRPAQGETQSQAPQTAGESARVVTRRPWQTGRGKATYRPGQAERWCRLRLPGRSRASHQVQRASSRSAVAVERTTPGRARSISRLPALPMAARAVRGKQGRLGRFGEKLTPLSELRPCFGIRVRPVHVRSARPLLGLLRGASRPVGALIRSVHVAPRVRGGRPLRCQLAKIGSRFQTAPGFRRFRWRTRACPTAHFSTRPVRSASARPGTNHRESAQGWEAPLHSAWTE